MTSTLPIEIELPYAIETVNANVLDVLSELTNVEIDHLPRNHDLTLTTHHIHVWQPWKHLGACGAIRLVKLGELTTRLRLIPPAYPTFAQCCEVEFDQPGITEIEGKRKVLQQLYREKHQAELPMAYEPLYAKDFEIQVFMHLSQRCTDLAKRQADMYRTVVERLAQVLKFTLENPGKEIAEAPSTDQTLEKDQTNPLPGKEPQTTPPTRVTLLVEVNGVLLPDYATAKGSFSDYSPDTARRIIEGLPGAYRKFQLAGGRWGPLWVGKEVGINASTVSRYFKVFYEANILEVQGIPIPYSPRQAPKK